MNPGELYKKEFDDNHVEWNYILSDDYIVHVFDDGSNREIDVIHHFFDRLSENDADVKLCDQSLLDEADALVLREIKKAVRKEYESSQKFVEVVDALKLELQKQEFKKARDAGKEA